MANTTQERTSPAAGSKNAYATLLTRPSYLAGAILLAYSLHKHSPTTPLIILYTPETLPEPCIQALEAEARHTGCIPRPVSHLRLPPRVADAAREKGMVAERFIDTWSKLRVFEVWDAGFEKVCFLDSDMLIFRDPSPRIFNPDEGEVKEGELMASHACVCNLDRDAWAPKDWNQKNCAHTGETPDSAPPPVTDDPPTHAMMNTGTFVFRPTARLSAHVLEQFNGGIDADTLASMKFPDQDFLNEVFHGKWRSLHWSTNALKTWRYWHENMWRDGEVCVLHYIVDKPWAKRVGADGVAGYKGLDGETHGWWWTVWKEWVSAREADGEKEEVKTVNAYTDQGGEGEGSEELRAIGGGAQAFAKKWDDGENDESGKEKEQTAGDDASKTQPSAIHKPLGERGHGPLAKDRPAELAASSHEPKIRQLFGYGAGKGKGLNPHGVSYMQDG
jgi:inositol 3-alpha-galactosyltransferase